MQELNILFYGDDRVDADGSFGVSDLMRFVTEELKTVVDVNVEFVHRHRNYLTGKQEVPGANKLAWKFLDRYHELWIFGDKQANVASKDVKSVQPYNELDCYEQAVLLEWMKDRGLMITGDHSQIFPDSKDYCDKDHSKFINLGAAIGRHVPRAHQLRVWDGPPTRCAGPSYDNQNTIDGPDPTKFDSDEELQFDAIPQRIVTQSIPHKLFSWVNPAGQVGPITVFPDHQHEGRVLEPTLQELDKNWPIGAAPPQVIAWGHDKRPIRSGKEYALVVAFDGDPVNVGRIVADSSFHHYINPNLEDIPSRDCGGNPKPGTDLDQISQYFCNLALWLAPKAIRDQLKTDLLFALAIHPLVKGARGMGEDTLGRLARMAAELEIGPANVYRILGLSNEGGGDVNSLISTAFENAVSAAGPAQPDPPTPEIVLGSIIQEFHEYFFSLGTFSPSPDEAVPTSAIVDKGFRRAFQ